MSINAPGLPLSMLLARPTRTPATSTSALGARVSPEATCAFTSMLDANRLTLAKAKKSRPNITAALTRPTKAGLTRGPRLGISHPQWPSRKLRRPVTASGLGLLLGADWVLLDGGPRSPGTRPPSDPRGLPPDPPPRFGIRDGIRDGSRLPPEA